MTKKLELIERAISSTRYNSQPKQRRQANPYQLSPVELQALPDENLAPRLGLTLQASQLKEKNLPPKNLSVGLVTATQGAWDGSFIKKTDFTTP
ncbi:MAG: hypothetical protein ACYTXT_40220 [Nostoc sp.]